MIPAALLLAAACLAIVWVVLLSIEDEEPTFDYWVSYVEHDDDPA